MFKKISQNFVKSPLKFCRNLTDFSPQLMACMGPLLEEKIVGMCVVTMISAYSLTLSHMMNISVNA